MKRSGNIRLNVFLHHGYSNKNNILEMNTQSFAEFPDFLDASCVIQYTAPSRYVGCCMTDEVTAVRNRGGGRAYTHTHTHAFRYAVSVFLMVVGRTCSTNEAQHAPYKSRLR